MRCLIQIQSFNALVESDDRNLNKGGSVFILTPGNAKIQIDKYKLLKYRYEMQLYEFIKEHSFIEVLRKILDPCLAQMLKVYRTQAAKVIEYMQSLEGQKLFDQDKQAVSDFFAQIIKGKRTFGLNVINTWLDENIGDKCDLRLESGKYEKKKDEDGTFGKNYKKHFWAFIRPS